MAIIRKRDDTDRGKRVNEGQEEEGGEERGGRRGWKRETLFFPCQEHSD